MHLQSLLITALAGLPATLAIYDPDAPPPTGDGPALMALGLPETANGNGQPLASDSEDTGENPGVTATALLPEYEDEEGEVSHTALPTDGSPPTEGEVANTDADPVVYDFAFVGPEWRALQILDSSTGTLVDVLPDSKITITFEETGSFGGHAGCNNYQGAYTDATDATFAIEGPMAVTLMICASEAVNAQESSYLQLLDGVIGWTASDDGTGLELTDAEGTVLAQYTSEAYDEDDGVDNSGAGSIRMGAGVLAAVVAAVGLL